MAAIGALTGGPGANFPLNAWLLNALADAATCLLLVRLGVRLGEKGGPRWAGYAAALVWSIAPFSVTFSIGGLETSVYVCLLTALALAYVGRRRALTGLLGALAILTRPDAVLLVGPLILDRLVRVLRRKDEPLCARELLAFFVPTLGWAAFATWMFGSPVPHSVQAKLGAYILPANDALIRLIQHYATPFMENNLLGPALAVGLGLLLYPFLFVVGARRIHRSEPRLLAWLAYPWLYFLAFAIPNPLIFRWYLTPPLPAYFLAILAGIEVLMGGKAFTASKSPALLGKEPTPTPQPSASNNSELPAAINNQQSASGNSSPSSSFTIQHSSFSIPIPHFRAVLLLVLLLLPTLLSLTEWRLRPDHGGDRPAPLMAWYQLELLYRQAADLVAPQMTPDSVLAAGDVGVLGYYTPGRILDTVGLNSPEALAYYPLDKRYYVINYAIAPDLILDRQPDWLVLLEVYGRSGLLPDPRFQARYELVRKIPTDIYGSDGMLIFRRRGP
jgi:hypothetical protein